MTEKKEIKIVDASKYLCTEIKEEERLSSAKTDLSDLLEKSEFYELPDKEKEKRDTTYEIRICVLPYKAGRLCVKEGREDIKEGDHMVANLYTKPNKIKIGSKEYLVIDEYSSNIVLRK